MNFKRKCRIDLFVGEPLCVALNLLVRLLGFVLRRDHSLKIPPRRILVIKLVGLGSIVNAVPALRALREQYPKAELGFLTTQSCAALVSHLPYIETVYALRDGGLLILAWDVLRFLAGAWRRRFDLVVDLEVHSRFSTLLSTLTAGRDRAGFFLSSTRFRTGLYTHLLYYNRTRHVIEAYLQLARAVGCNPTSDALEAPRLTEEDEANAADCLAQQGLARDVSPILVNPNAGELCEERRWPAEGFVRVIGELVKAGAEPVLIVGSPAERARNEEVMRLLADDVRPRVYNVAGGTTFGGFLALLRRGRVLLTNDSGPLHLAAALGVPTVSLWGPGLPATYRPRVGEHRIIIGDVYCSPCLYLVDDAPCAGAAACMRSIPWQSVARSAFEILGLKAPPHLLADDAGEESGAYLPGVVVRHSVRVTKVGE